MKRYLGPLCFLVFCFLVAFRDVLTDSLQFCRVGSSQDCIHPTGLLLTWCIEFAVLAWLVRSIRKKSFAFISPFRKLTRQQKLDFVGLGIATCVVYIVTVHGIRMLGAPVFNLIDYGIMPVLTLCTAYWINKERIWRNQIVGAIFSVCGIGLLLSARMSDAIHWKTWILLAFLSPLFTAVCSSLQRRQVRQGMTPDEVLLYRFPLPAIVMAVWFCIDKLRETPDAPISLPLHHIPTLLFIGAVAGFLPLWLLCYAFMHSSVRRLASYLFLIAVFTFALAPLLSERPNPARLPAVWAAAVLLLVGYLVAEGLIWRRRRSEELNPATT